MYSDDCLYSLYRTKTWSIFYDTNAVKVFVWTELCSNYNLHFIKFLYFFSQRQLSGVSLGSESRVHEKAAPGETSTARLFSSDLRPEEESASTWERLQSHRINSRERLWIRMLSELISPAHWINSHWKSRLPPGLFLLQARCSQLFSCVLLSFQEHLWIKK